MTRPLFYLNALALGAVLSVAVMGGALAQQAEAPATDAQAAPAGDKAAADRPAPEKPAESGNISGSYQFDPEHSQIMFTYDHLGFSTSRGFVNGVNGSVTLDQADPAKSRVEASFPLSAIRTVAPALDRQLFSDDFFKGLTPETAVTFTSTAVKPDGDKKAEVTGDLTLNGVTRPLTLEVEMTQAGAHPMTGKPAVGFRIEGKILRSDFNLGAFVPAVSDEVELDIAVEASKS